jgi:hypothetical protein
VTPAVTDVRSISPARAVASVAVRSVSSSVIACESKLLGAASESDTKSVGASKFVQVPVRAPL